MTKIDIISGFLGAGKTTLIKKLLKEALADTKVVLIENEFGEIGIDGGFLKEAGIEIKEMNSGCICCSLVGDFGTSLQEVLKTYEPQRILIEPSGVGKLSDVMKAVEQVQTDVEVALNSAVAVVDASKCKLYLKNFGEFFVNQIEHAGTIILSRTGNISEEKLKNAVDLIRTHNKTAVIITTPWEQLEGEHILKTIEEANDWEEKLLSDVVAQHTHDQEHHGHQEHGADCTCGCHEEDGHDHAHGKDHACDKDHQCHAHDEHHCGHEHHGHDHHDHAHDAHDCGHDHRDHTHDHGPDCTCGCHDHDDHHGHHHADEVFTSWGKQTPVKYTKEEIRTILKQLEDEKQYGFVLRAKGMLPAEDGSFIYFDYVPGESDIREGSAEVTGKLCVIGSKLKEENLEQLFAK